MLFVVSFNRHLHVGGTLARYLVLLFLRSEMIWFLHDVLRMKTPSCTQHLKMLVRSWSAHWNKMKVVIWQGRRTSTHSPDQKWLLPFAHNSADRVFSTVDYLKGVAGHSGWLLLLLLSPKKGMSKTFLSLLTAGINFNTLLTASQCAAVVQATWCQDRNMNGRAFPQPTSTSSLMPASFCCAVQESGAYNTPIPSSV